MRRLTIPFLIFFAPFVARAAFGISPPFLNTDHLVAGTTYTQVVYLVQDQPDQDLNIKAILAVPAHIVPWISIDRGFNFVIPKGTRQFPVTVTVHVPDGEGIGKYSGNLSFTGQPSQSGQVTIAIGVNVAINLTVGTGIYEDFSVSMVTFPDIEEGWSPKAYVRFENRGNIPEAFNSATFDLYDKYDSVRLAYVTKQDGFPDTPPFTTKEYIVEFPTDFHLGIGDYWGSVNFYKNDKVIATQKTIFHVLKAGSLSTPLEMFFSSVKNNIVYYVIGLILIFIIVRRLRRKKTR